MLDTVLAFHHELQQEVLAYAEAVEAFAEDAFFDVVTGYLVDAGEIETADRARYEARADRAEVSRRPWHRRLADRDHQQW